MNTPATSGLRASDSRPLRQTLALPLILTTCGLALAACSKQAGPMQTPPPEVATIVVAPQEVTLTTELPGRTAACRIAEIRPQVNGVIRQRLFTEGSLVEAGQELYQIDPAPYQAAYESALAALGRAEANLPATRARASRYEGLAADRAVSQQGADDAAAALRQAEADVLFYRAAVQNACINLAYTKIVSPIAGRIGRSSVTDGAIVTAYQPLPLATVQQLDPIYVDVTQSTNELLRLKRRLAENHLSAAGDLADRMRLILGDGRPYPFEGALQVRDLEVDPSTSTVTLRAIFPNPEGFLLPNMFVRATITEGVNGSALLIPQQAVSRNTKGEPVALVVNAEKKIEPRLLTIDRAIGTTWLVTDGLAAGDHLVVEGLQKARPGATVRETAFEAAPQTTAAK